MHTIQPAKRISAQENRAQENRAQQILPLVRSIGHELAERLEAVHALEKHLIVRAQERADSTEFFPVIAEAATHYRYIRLARNELKQLGCSVVGESPLTLRIPAHQGEGAHSVLWQSSPSVDAQSSRA